MHARGMGRVLELHDTIVAELGTIKIELRDSVVAELRIIKARLPAQPP